MSGEGEAVIAFRVSFYSVESRFVRSLRFSEPGLEAFSLGNRIGMNGNVRDDVRAWEVQMLALCSHINLCTERNLPFQTDRAKRARVGNILAMTNSAGLLSRCCLRSVCDIDIFCSNCPRLCKHYRWSSNYWGNAGKAFITAL